MGNHTYFQRSNDTEFTMFYCRRWKEQLTTYIHPGTIGGKTINGMPVSSTTFKLHNC